MPEEKKFSASQISLPKGGGAIRGIGEKFQVNPVTGTGSLSVPIYTTPGRSDFYPKLSLSYDTGNGNGPFGMGWKLSIPSITRKTEKGLPKYTNEDVFVLSGAEDLVSFLDEETGEPISYSRGDYEVSLYRPRTEGLFAKIEKWVCDADIHWRVTTKDNVTSIYGRTKGARICDPDNEQHIFQWLLQETLDDRGNHVLYEYMQEDPDLERKKIYESNRRYTQCYIRRILYGNTSESLDPDAWVGPKRISLQSQNGSELIERHYLFEVLFDYGDLPLLPEIPYELPASEETIPEDFPVRDDPFSMFRAGFEIRTLRRCRRVLMLHHFKELTGAPLVKSSDFFYENSTDTKLSFLTSYRITGYRKDVDAYRVSSMPPVMFTYSEFQPHKQRYKSVEAEGGDVPPNSLKDPNFALVDLFGDAIPDILQINDSGYYFWQNLGNAKLDRRRLQSSVPSGLPESFRGAAFGDMGGDGLIDLIVEAPPISGFFEATPAGTWKPFKRFETFPSLNLSDPNARLLDLTGDGLSDVLVTRDNHFLWYECLGEKGYAESQQVDRIHDKDEFPDIFFDDISGRVRLADMSGDGLNDIVMIHDGHIDYWPNLGYGRFGKRISMSNAPRFEYNFDPRRLFLADINGSGCADLVYVDVNSVHFWFNQSGNGWSDKLTIFGTPYVADSGNVQFADFFGTGTATLVWSYDYNFQHGSNYKVLDLCGGIKPYLLTEMSNNMGATTRIEYASSTKYYLEDKKNGTPWVTNLPFPVQVVEKVEVIDHISKTKLATKYKYHHGYYDGREREFRGFGRVDQFDTEIFEGFVQSGLHGDASLFENKDGAYYVPPIETRTWFHTGIYFDEEKTGSDETSFFDYRELTNKYCKEYYKGDPEAYRLQDHTVETEDTPHEAFRALRGAMLRSEVYSRDRSSKDRHPYLVTENNYLVKQLQPKGVNKHAVYLSTQEESLSFHYERNPEDPRMAHQVTLEIDDFGNITKSAAIGYPRRTPQYPEQSKTYATCTENVFTNKPNESEWYRIGVPVETRTYEITGLPSLTEDKPLYTQDDLLDALQNAASIPYEDKPSEGALQKRLIGHVRTLYLKDNLTGALPLGDVESLGFPYESYKAAFTQGLISKIYGDKLDESLLGDEGKYILWDNLWWIPSGRSFFSPEPHAPDSVFAKQHFYLPHGTIDPFDSIFHISYDRYDLLIVETKDALNNAIYAENNYRTLQPELVTDPNGNRSQVIFDTLGMVVGTAIMGKIDEIKGDSLEGFEVDLNEDIITAHIENPLDNPHAILKGATTRLVYDVSRYYREGKPNAVYTLTREIHCADLQEGELAKIQHSFLYSDGFGREIQSKIQAEAGDINGNYAEYRWVGAGSKVYNNKGKQVRQYEPFFSDTHLFGIEQRGVSPTIFYDSLERVVATLHPNHTYEKVVFDPWQQETWDVNDTVSQPNPENDPDVGHYFDLLPEADYMPTWYERMISGTLEEQEAAEKTMIHAATPTVAHLDTLGRTFLTIADNGLNEEGDPQKYETRVVLDIEGNKKEITDPRLNTVMQYSYDMLSNQVYQNNVDTGKRWSFSNIIGNIFKQWDERNHEFTLTYDKLRRPCGVHVTGGDGPTPLNNLHEKINYGDFEGMTEAKRDAAKKLNLIGNPKEHYHTGGRVKFKLYDFKGNLKKNTIQLLNDYKNLPNWTDDNLQALLEQEHFDTEAEYDALHRVTQTKTPDGSITIPTYNEAGLLKKVEVTQDAEAQLFVKNIDYNEKGERTRITYGNDVETSYEYDKETFRLIHLKTKRANNSFLQDLYYTYDPSGNITQIKDKNIPVHFFNNERIEGVSKYKYDPLYRLIEASGKEHIGQVDFGNNDNWNDLLFLKKYSSGDDMAWRNYTQSYKYDEVGNIMQMRHIANGGSWTRNYEYSDNDNRLIKTIVGVNNNDFDYSHHPRHGFITGMPHLEIMEWNCKEELKAVVKQRKEDGGTPETTYYVYNADGQRVRKVTENAAEPGNTPSKRCERIYVAGIEVYREYTGVHAGLERKTLHLIDDAKRIAMIETRNDVDDGSPKKLIRYQISNRLGSTCLETDDSIDARVISYEEYHPYGTTAYQAMNADIKAAAKRYRYTGKEKDGETGFYYHGARYYAPWIGRWISPDPLKNESVPPYVYVANNPINSLDPLGLQEEKIKEVQPGFWRTPESKPAQNKPSPASRLPKDLRSPEMRELAAKFKKDPFSFEGFKTLVKGAVKTYSGTPQTPEGRPLTFSERWSMFASNIEVASLYSTGLGQNTALKIAGRPYDAEAIGEETTQNVFAFAGLFLRGAIAYQSYKSFTSELKASEILRLSQQKRYQQAQQTYNFAMEGALPGESAGLARSIEFMAWENWGLSSTQFKYSGVRGLDLAFEGYGQNLGFLATVEAKSGAVGLGSLSVPKSTMIVGGLRQGGYGWIGMGLQSYIYYGGDAVEQAIYFSNMMRKGFLKSFLITRKSVWELKFHGNVNFKLTPGAAKKIHDF